MCPIYEYYCKSCENTTEIIHKMDSKPNVRCDNCRAYPDMVKVISSAGLRFKGDGFYINDSKRAKGNKK
jgi:putative FmdB family regulatory protein